MERRRMELTEKHKTLIEKIGVALEQKGQRPAAARIIGLLYVADTPELTFDEVCEALLLSKSATSNALSFLLQNDMLEYITHCGDRKRYFRLKMANWQDEFVKQMQNITGFNELLQQVLETRTSSTPEYNTKIKELSSFLDYVSGRLPQLMQDWKNKEKNLAA
ncbi:GbsR/MarR family transcriptional regulator [Cesiribacter sp. SM1]|uniref:GbsR/MarR family transcriptional regulator n=1 Tax=Cesiribacter sp. SM1 TaxID=2861196 RepID=UPI001CD749DA|nr:MarR family transcriptional regulator [Cesiribacter sp. SM1]